MNRIGQYLKENSRSAIFSQETMKNQFTLINAFKQSWAVSEFGERPALSHAGLTYFYLCHVWNSTGRSASFRRLNTIICAELVISKPTLARHLEILTHVY